MTEQAKLQRNAYMREWRKRNRDKVRASNARYWEKKAELAEETGEGGADEYLETD